LASAFAGERGGSMPVIRSGSLAAAACMHLRVRLDG
jgi:hypothetical protein